MASEGELWSTVLFLYLLFIDISTVRNQYEDPKGLSDAIIAIQELLKVIENSKGMWSTSKPGH